MPQNRVILRFDIQAYSQSEILKLLPADILVDLKKRDPHPFLQMYAIAHEGESAPKIISKDKPGNPRISWPRKAIQSIKDFTLKGLKFFKAHNKDNSTENRRELGEVVYDFQQEINGNLHHMAISYHPQDVVEEVKKYDICSQEGTWDFLEDGKKWIADKLLKLKGIALGNSAEDTPAFSGAKRFAMVQAFEQTPGEGDIKTGETGKAGEVKGEKGMPDITFDMVKKFIKDHRVYPHDIYTVEDLKDDRQFGKIYDETKTITKENEELKKSVETITARETELVKAGELKTAEDRYSKLLEGIEKTDKLGAFLKGSTSELKNVKDLSDEGLKKFVEDQSAIFQRVTKCNQTDGTPPKTPPKKGSGSGEKDYTDPKDNEWLEEE